ncbi:hypothetical protein [Mycobacterium ostraviense]|uniref:hypothetical protein n=1 Tax=Mycobacterium ostraviense TaxID=2738409 RepID=UPI001E29DDAC|nr:hypothetical protein [Mycobacterium ostraviense]UGT91531.1 hypothetical protein LTS72_25850 [Mycobacterium ostraviense]
MALLEPGLAGAVATVIAAAGQLAKVIAAVKVIVRVSLRMAPTVLSPRFARPALASLAIDRIGDGETSR